MTDGWGGECGAELSFPHYFSASYGGAKPIRANELVKVNYCKPWWCKANSCKRGGESKLVQAVVDGGAKPVGAGDVMQINAMKVNYAQAAALWKMQHVQECAKS